MRWRYGAENTRQARSGPRIRESIDREVEIDYDNRLFECVPDRVLVSIRISEKGRRVLANVPPTILVDDDSASVLSAIPLQQKTAIRDLWNVPGWAPTLMRAEIVAQRASPTSS